MDALSSGILPDMREFLAALRLAEQSEIGAFPEEGSTDVIERLIELDAFAYTGRRAGVSGDLGERLRGSGEPVPFAQTPPPLPYRSPYRFPYCSLNVCFICFVSAVSEYVLSRRCACSSRPRSPPRPRRPCTARCSAES